MLSLVSVVCYQVEVSATGLSRVTQYVGLAYMTVTARAQLKPDGTR